MGRGATQAIPGLVCVRNPVVESWATWSPGTERAGMDLETTGIYLLTGSR
jgi:hypothetical protein